VKDWKSLGDGLWENKENAFAKFKIYHKTNANTLHFEFGIINDKKAEKVKSYLEDNYSIPEIKRRANTIVSINGIKFRIGCGPVAPYIVFKPEDHISLTLDEIDKSEFIQKFEKFKNDIISSGLDKLLDKIN
jgi:hypothetical protein